MLGGLPLVIGLSKLMCTNVFSFAVDLQEMEIGVHDILVSCDVSALFTNVPVDEMIAIFFILDLKPKLNKQSDSIRVKLFV